MNYLNTYVMKTLVSSLIKRKCWKIIVCKTSERLRDIDSNGYDIHTYKSNKMDKNKVSRYFKGKIIKMIKNRGAWILMRVCVNNLYPKIGDPI